MAKIRKFEPTDLPQILKIAKISFPKNRFYPKTFQKYYQAYSEGFIVSEELGEVIGYIVSQLKNGAGEIVSLAVKPNFRQKGIGTELIKFLNDHFKTIGFREIFSQIPADNNTALSLFQNLDFRIIKTIKNYRKKKDNAFLMIKSISN